MAKTKISEFSTTAGNNTDINSINIAEGCAPSGINDAIRELMRQLKEFQTGGAGDSVNSGGDFSVATNKFTVASASGNTAVAGTLAVTGVATLTAQPILSSLTASKAVFTDASKGLVSNDVTGTGNVVMSNSPTLVTPALGTPSSGVVTNLTGTASININGTVGATTPSTGAFTTLSSTGNTTLGDASGDTITVNGTTTFVNANPTLSAGTANGVLYLNGSKVATAGSALVFDGANLGLGVTPSAWDSSLFKVTQIGVTGAFISGRANAVNQAQFGLNAYYDGSSYKYVANGNSTRYEQNTGAHYWYNAASGNAGDAITFTQAMTLDASGRLGIGTTGPGYMVDANGGSTTDGIQSTVNGALLGLKITQSNTAQDAVIRLQSNGHFYDVRATGSGNAYTISYDGTERARIDSSGNLGIGTTSPSSYNSGGNNLVVGGSGNYKGMTIACAIEGNIYFADGTSGTETYRGVVGYNHTSDFMAFYTAANERARIDSSGNLLVGATSQRYTERFRVIGATVGAVIESASGYVTQYLRNDGASGTRKFVSLLNSSSTECGSITYDGSTVAYNTTSDYRLKNNPQPLTGSGAFIDALQPKTWNWKADGSRGVGFIAHEVQTVSPGSVVGEKDGEQMQAMEYGSAEFIANIIAELQSLRKRLADAGIA